jgi:hypothetical protein
VLLLLSSPHHCQHQCQPMLHVVGMAATIGLLLPNVLPLFPAPVLLLNAEWPGCPAWVCEAILSAVPVI